MRSASSGGFRGRKKGRWGKLVFIFLVILAGMLTALEDRYKTLRIAEIEISPQAARLTSESVWREVPREAERFWPLLWASKRDYEAAIEKAHPVKAELLLKSWGRYKLDVEFLQPLFVLYWESKYWYVSHEGRMWPVTLPDNALIDPGDARKRPVLIWGGDRTTPFDIANADSNIHRSSLPVSLIYAWYDNVEILGWTEKIKSLSTGRREGLNVVKLVLNNAKGGDGAAILLPDAAEQWRGAGLAIKTIYPDITKISADIFIDMTYKGKIIVSNIANNKVK